MPLALRRPCIAALVLSLVAGLLTWTAAPARADGSPTVFLNQDGGTDATDGIRVAFGQASQFQIWRNGVNQTFGNSIPSDTTCDGTPFSGVFLGVGSALVGCSFTPWESVTLSGGSASGSGTMTADMSHTHEGLTYRVQLTFAYTAPEHTVLLSARVTVPEGNTEPVRLYYGLDSYLAGGDAGPGFAVPATGQALAVGVAKAGTSMAFTHLSGPQWAGWFSAGYSQMWPTPGQDYSKQINSNPSTDNGFGINYDFGTAPGEYLVSDALSFSDGAFGIKAYHDAVVAAGTEDLSYSITVQTPTTIVETITVTDDVPAGVNVTGVTADNGGVCQPAPAVECTFEGLTSGAPVTIDVDFDVDPAATSGTLTGAATVSWTGTSFTTNTATLAIAGAPVPTGAPVITGTVEVDGTLTATTGDWDSPTALTYTYQWQRCDGDGCVDIVGATGPSHTIANADGGSGLRVVVTATDTFGLSTAQASDEVGPVVAPAGISGVGPITGDATVGSTLRAGDVTVSGTQPVTVSHQWQRCDGGDCVDIDGATDTTYVLSDADLGHTIVVRVSATNDLGSATATSEPTAVVTAQVREVERFVDVAETHLFDREIHWLRDQGITRGCNPPANDRYCPEAGVTRAEMATLLVRTFGLTGGGSDLFVDDDHSVHRHDIDTLGTTGITRSCNPYQGGDRYCPDDHVTRAQMASFLVRALGIAPTSERPFTDSLDTVHAADIAALGEAGITAGCNPEDAGDKFCPDRVITRGELAALLYRAIG